MKKGLDKRDSIIQKLKTDNEAKLQLERNKLGKITETYDKKLEKEKNN